MPVLGSISPLDRDRSIAELERREFDLVVIGGGITGAGIAREAVLYGLSVALLEARDYAAGTSSRSSCTALLDSSAGEWAAGLLGFFQVPREALPEVVATSHVVGTTPSDLLGAPVPVVARAGDQQAAAFAQGVHTMGQAKLTLGTSAMLDLHVGSTPVTPEPGSYPLVLWWLGDSELAHCLEAP